MAVDDAPTFDVLREVCICAESWQPDVRLIGDVRAIDISRAVRDIFMNSPEAYVATMKTSAGIDYYVMIKRGDVEISNRRYERLNRAEYEAAELNYLFGRRSKPDILEYSDE